MVYRVAVLNMNSQPEINSIIQQGSVIWRGLSIHFGETRSDQIEPVWLDSSRRVQYRIPMELLGPGLNRVWGLWAGPQRGGDGIGIGWNS